MAFSRNAMVSGYALERHAEIQIISIGDSPEVVARRNRSKTTGGGQRKPFFR
jgi:hypothetical protein